MLAAASLDAQGAALLIGIFVLAGLVKGITGFGLPTVAVALLTITRGLTDGIALILAPALITNIWQALAGGHLREVLRRFSVMLAVAVLGIVAGSGVLARGDAARLSAILGGLLAVYSAFGLFAPRLPNPSRHEHWLSPLMGGITGLITGFTGSFLVPAVPYMQALGLPRELFVQAMGVAFVTATITLAAAMSGHGILPAELGLLSVACIVPALAGMVAGQQLRRRLPELLFRRIVLAALMIVGCYIAARALL
ncbi:MAG: sulfite exporter TauE/SafE family protein [Alphaproteobacteria bacterium]|nr:sulfite exporter TauE/SafE family protein [Alphaproteobacteria bacterium]